MHIGIDIGKVIIGGAYDDIDSSIFGPKYLDTPAVPGAFMAVYELLETGFEVSLISRCGTKVAQRTMEILDHLEFWDLTGLTQDRVYFVKKHADKAFVAKALGIDIFIDDMQKNLTPMQDTIETILFTDYKNWEAIVEYINYKKVSVWPLRKGK